MGIFLNKPILGIRLNGSPSLATVKDVEVGLADLAKSLIGKRGAVTVSTYIRCDTCGERMGPIDLSDPHAEDKIRRAGWTRDPDAQTDTCPNCA